jgi:transposase InsO family protein
MPWSRHCTRVLWPTSLLITATEGFGACQFATLEWVDWFNNRRLLEPIGNIPPVEYEEMYC